MRWGKRPRGKQGKRGFRVERSGIRITIPGNCAVEDLGMRLLQAVAHLEALKVTHTNGVNLYVTPTTARGTETNVLRDDGTRVSAITIEHL